AAGGEPLDVARAARRAHRPRVEVGPPAVGAPLDAQLAGRAAVPERLGVGGRHQVRLFRHAPFPPARPRTGRVSRPAPDTMATGSQSRVIELTSLNRMLFWN